MKHSGAEQFVKPRPVHDRYSLSALARSARLRGLNMTYGYRLNIEDIYLEAADKHWEHANFEMKDVKELDLVTRKVHTSFRAPDTELGLKFAVQAVVGWAVCLEAFVNHAWSQSIAKQMPSSELNQIVMMQLNTYKKIKEILRNAKVGLDNKPWLADIKALFELRNYLVHYKEKEEFIGYSFAPRYLKLFEENRMKSYRSSLREAVLAIGGIVTVPTDFISGSFKVVTING